MVLLFKLFFEREVEFLLLCGFYEETPFLLILVGVMLKQVEQEGDELVYRQATG